ncbi:MAG: NAD(P)/FAD-dependent oxidoreductase [Alphaproteobacteria bacterium]|nr:NAD(P)/FAD-dependent oxidoreductase [Alphaproteobacteria bacterium]
MPQDDAGSHLSGRATGDVDVIVVGAGFAGMYLLHRLRKLGVTARVFEAGSGVGGTWYWNRYPGARCDVESMQYSYAFSEELQQEWKWSELFSGQPEILTYANHVADRFDLRRDITFNTRVTSATWDATADVWTVGTDTGETVVARHVVMATGCLSSSRMPDIAGLDSFRGRVFHTGQWPHEQVEFTGRRVAVIGTGSSAIQSIPVIAEQAGHLTVFQRTPNFSIPSRNGPMTTEYEQSWKRDYATRREEARHMRSGVLSPLNDKSALADDAAARRDNYEARWSLGGTYFMQSYNDLALNKASNDTAVEFVHAKIRETVSNPSVAAKLLPTNHPIGTKRICVDTHYYETYNRANVTLVDLHETPINRITPEGVETAGQTYAVDDIVLATGFDAMTGTLLRIDITGRDGITLRDKWDGGPRTYLGLMTQGLPNMFMITGPGSPSVLSNMMVSIEQHVDWIVGCVDWMRAHGKTAIEADLAAENAWVEHVNEVAYRTLYPQANSWYMGANVPGKPQVFMPYIGGVGAYRAKCDEVAAAGYAGFALSGAKATAAAAE